MLCISSLVSILFHSISYSLTLFRHSIKHTVTCEARLCSSVVANHSTHTLELCVSNTFCIMCSSYDSAQKCWMRTPVTSLTTSIIWWLAHITTLHPLHLLSNLCWKYGAWRQGWLPHFHMLLLCMVQHIYHYI